MARIRHRGKSRFILGFLAVCCAAGLALFVGTVEQPLWQAADGAAGRRPTGSPQLVSIEPLPPEFVDGEMCQWVPASSPMRLAAAIRQEQMMARNRAAAADAGEETVIERAPLRVIRDPYPTFSHVVVDPVRDEIVLQDENLFQILVYDRRTNTPETANFSEPKRMIGGHETKIEFNCAIYVDPASGDIYSVNNDTIDTMVVFSRNARGNVHPDRELHTPHRTYGIAVDEEAQELYLTVQHPPQIVVYKKDASGDDKPIRVLRGNKTQLEDAHGIALDKKNGLMIVANYGNISYYTEETNAAGDEEGGRTAGRIQAGTGKYMPPAITIYPLKAEGDTAPIRVIEGPKTQMNWPAHIAVDDEHGEIFVANDGGGSVLVFKVTDNGDVAPTRVLKGSTTQIMNPTGVSIDKVNDELVVANMGNHRALTFPRDANGNVAPKRVLRAAPAGKTAQQIGNPGAVAYDTKREQILVPN